MLCVFATLGRASHDGGVTVGGVAGVAAPFVVGWLLGAGLTRLDRAPLSVVRAASAWAIGIPAGLALRALSGGGLAPAFVAVALLTTALLLLGWRALVRVATRAGRSGSPLG